MCKKFRWILCLLAITMPFFIVLIYTYNDSTSIMNIKPVFGDEQWWWQQANAVVEYGKPLGYWGYNGSRAQIGTYGAWGPAMVMPYALFGEIFGWNLQSYLFANVFYLGLSTLIFIKLTKISNRNLILLIICNMFLVVKNWYMFTAMMECTRYALGIVALACMIYIYENPDCNKMFKFLFVPLYLFYITQAYMIYGMFFMLYLLCILRKHCNLYINLAITTIGTAMVVCLTKWLLSLLSAPYTATEDLPFFLKILKSLKVIKNIFLESNAFLKWFMITYLVLAASIIIWLLFFYLKKTVTERNLLFGVTTEFILMAFLGGHIVFYSNMTDWTLIRGLSVGLILAVFVLSLLDDNRLLVIFLLCILA